jgi:hypothetical protein
VLKAISLSILPLFYLFGHSIVEHTRRRNTFSTTSDVTDRTPLLAGASAFSAPEQMPFILPPPLITTTAPSNGDMPVQGGGDGEGAAGLQRGGRPVDYGSAGAAPWLGVSSDNGLSESPRSMQ